jgi:ABC-type phosphate transport system ATPase subunit
MNKYLGLSEFVGFNSEFRNAINLDLNLNHKEKLQSYIPTKSSVDILKRYLLSIINNQMHASMLIGPYGKGKSHLLLYRWMVRMKKIKLY